MVQPLCKKAYQVLTKYTFTINILLPYDSPITLLGIYPRVVHTKTCMKMFIAALFIYQKIREQPRCPSVCEQRNKLWYIQTMKYYLAQNNKWSKKTWGSFKFISLNAICQLEKAYYVSNNITYWKRQKYRDNKKVNCCQRLGKESE